MFYARHLLLLPLLLLLPIGAVAAPLPLPETSSLSGPNLSQAPNLEVRAGAGDLPGVHPIILRLSALQHDFDIHRGNYYRLQDALGRLGWPSNELNLTPEEWNRQTFDTLILGALQLK
ncbi:hypothetical protein CF335_g4514 [Tilletia laevis]|nr:hypothetical protein CF335_g4514 [Tilletia laevis]